MNTAGLGVIVLRKTTNLAAILLFVGFTAVRFAAAEDASQFVSQSVPNSMTVGFAYSVSVTMLNTGTSTWTPFGANPYRLGAQNPQDNGTWGLGRVNLPSTVPPGTEVTFNFPIIAPSTPGTYNFQWRMVHELVGWFGDLTPNVAIVVGQDAAQFVSQSVPSSMMPGLTYPVSVTMLNTGTTTWTSRDFYSLGKYIPDADAAGYISLPESVRSVPPNAQVTFHFTITARQDVGIYNFQWRMIRGRFDWFGDFTPNVAIAVGEVPNPFFVFSAVALQGQEAPGTGGGAFSNFFLKPSLNDKGELVFAAVVKDGSSTSGLFLFSQGSVTPVALRGQILADGKKLLSFNDFAINNSGDVAFVASFESDSGVKSGLFLYSGGEIVTIALPGQIAADGTNIGTPRSLAFNDLGAIAFSTADGRIFLHSNGSILLIAAANPSPNFISSFAVPAINNSAQIAIVFVNQSTGFRGSLSNAGVSLYSGGIVSTIFNGSNLSTLDINDAGTVVFYGCAAACGIYRYSDSQALLVVGASRKTLGAPQINNSGEIAFAEESVFDSVGMLARLTLYRNGVSTQIGRQDAPPGPPGNRFDAFGPPSLNNLGALGFIASFVTPSPDGGATTLKGVFIASPGETRLRRRP